MCPQPHRITEDAGPSAKVLSQQAVDSRHAGGSTNEQHHVNVPWRHCTCCQYLQHIEEHIIV